MISDRAIHDLIDDIDKTVKSFADQAGRIDRNDNVRVALCGLIREWFIDHARAAVRRDARGRPDAA